LLSLLARDRAAGLLPRTRHTQPGSGFAQQPGPSPAGRVLVPGAFAPSSVSRSRAASWC